MKRMVLALGSAFVLVSIAAASAAPRAPIACTATSAINRSPSYTALEGIARVSPRIFWAVGSYRSASGTVRTLTERYSGAAWRVVPSPDEGSGFNRLAAVAVAAPRDVWAVGWHAPTEAGTARALVEHWNGLRWSVIKGPSLGKYGGHLADIGVVSPRDLWVIGDRETRLGSYRTFAARYLAGRWVITRIPAPGGFSYLLGLGIVSASDAWAVGSWDRGDASHTLAEHWNGQTWTQVTTPNPTLIGTGFGDVAAGRHRTAWAVGSFEQHFGGGSVPLIERYFGGRWHVVRLPATPHGDGDFSAVGATRDGGAWAVGISETHTRVFTLVERRTPGGWKIVPSGNKDQFSVLTDVAAVSSTRARAVGYQGSDTGPYRTLTESCD